MEPVTGYQIDQTLVYEATSKQGELVEYKFEKGVVTPSNDEEAAILEALCAAGVVSKAAPKSSKTTKDSKE